MKIKELFWVIKAYLRAHVIIVIFYLLWNAIYFVVLFLHNVSLVAASYALLLVTLLALAFLCMNFYRFYQRHQQLLQLIHHITDHLEPFPKTIDLIEQDYQDLLQAIQVEKIERISQWDQKITNLTDYYTLWTHQIKTPIAALKLLLQETQAENTSQALQELFKIERYVESAIQYARLENITSDLRFEKIVLDQLVKQAVKKYATIFIHNKIALNYEDLGVIVLTDEKWLVFVIEQILSNALKYTPKGSISIYLDSNSERTLVIEDTGIGIQIEDLPRVFEKAFTGYNGRMDKKSTGIGLYLCKQILDKLSHSISITSEVGIGTQVRIDLSSVKIDIE